MKWSGREQGKDWSNEAECQKRLSKRTKNVGEVESLRQWVQTGIVRMAASSIQCLIAPPPSPLSDHSYEYNNGKLRKVKSWAEGKIDRIAYNSFFCHFRFLSFLLFGAFGFVRFSLSFNSTYPLQWFFFACNFWDLININENRSKKNCMTTPMVPWHGAKLCTIWLW